MESATGPTLLGFDVIVVGSIMAGIAAMAVVFAIYTALTIKDPMAKRVRALEGRREELKMGLVTSTAKKRQSPIPLQAIRWPRRPPPYLWRTLVQLRPRWLLPPGQPIPRRSKRHSRLPRLRPR